jgi:hypothetical protein
MKLENVKVNIELEALNLRSVTLIIFSIAVISAKAWGHIYLFFLLHLTHLSFLFSLFLFSFARGNMIYYSFYLFIFLHNEESLSCYGVAAVSYMENMRLNLQDVVWLHEIQIQSFFLKNKNSKL